MPAALALPGVTTLGQGQVLDQPHPQIRVTAALTPKGTRDEPSQEAAVLGVEGTMAGTPLSPVPVPGCSSPSPPWPWTLPGLLWAPEPGPALTHTSNSFSISHQTPISSIFLILQALGTWL